MDLCPLSDPRADPLAALLPDHAHQVVGPRLDVVAAWLARSIHGFQSSTSISPRALEPAFEGREFVFWPPPAVASQRSKPRPPRPCGTSDPARPEHLPNSILQWKVGSMELSQELRLSLLRTQLLGLEGLALVEGFVTFRVGHVHLLLCLGQLFPPQLDLLGGLLEATLPIQDSRVQRSLLSKALRSTHRFVTSTWSGPSNLRSSWISKVLCPSLPLLSVDSTVEFRLDVGLDGATLAPLIVFLTSATSSRLNSARSSPLDLVPLALLRHVQRSRCVEEQAFRTFDLSLLLSHSLTHSLTSSTARRKAQHLSARSVGSHAQKPKKGELFLLGERDLA